MQHPTPPRSLTLFNKLNTYLYSSVSYPLLHRKQLYAYTLRRSIGIQYLFKFESKMGSVVKCTKIFLTYIKKQKLIIMKKRKYVSPHINVIQTETTNLLELSPKDGAINNFGTATIEPDTKKDDNGNEIDYSEYENW